MLKKVGKRMSISSVEDSILVETCSYRSGSILSAVILRDGRWPRSPALKTYRPNRRLRRLHPVSR
jgi:hypothetical protein